MQNQNSFKIAHNAFSYHHKHHTNIINTNITKISKNKLKM